MARDAAAREFFSRPSASDGDPGFPHELPAYLSALAPLISPRRLAVDAGTGDGSLLDVLAPIFEHVVAIDRADPQLERARRRVSSRGYAHVELVAGELEDPAILERVHALGGADAVFASRVLHHAPKPVEALKALAALARPAARSPSSITRRTSTSASVSSKPTSGSASTARSSSASPNARVFATRT